MPEYCPYLEKVGLREKVEFLSCKEDRVLARDISKGDLVKTLEADSNWKELKKSRWFGFYGHKGAVRSWRYLRSPSLQITQVEDKLLGSLLDIDTDRWRGRKKHFLREVAVHAIRKHFKFLFFVPRYTKQKNIKDSLAKWK